MGESSIQRREDRRELQQEISKLRARIEKLEKVRKVAWEVEKHCHTTACMDDNKSACICYYTRLCAALEDCEASEL